MRPAAFNDEPGIGDGRTSFKRERAKFAVASDGTAERHAEARMARSEDEVIAERSSWFAFYTKQRSVFTPPSGGPYTCPCCGHGTLDERGAYEICDVCGWEDDGQDDHTTARPCAAGRTVCSA